MRLPNKVISYKESVLSRFPIILNILIKEEISPNELYEKVKDSFEDVGEFIEVLDCLFAIGEIDLENGELLYYVGRSV